MAHRAVSAQLAERVQKLLVVLQSLAMEVEEQNSRPEEQYLRPSIQVAVRSELFP